MKSSALATITRWRISRTSLELCDRCEPRLAPRRKAWAIAALDPDQYWAHSPSKRRRLATSRVALDVQLSPRWERTHPPGGEPNRGRPQLWQRRRNRWLVEFPKRV